MRPLTVEEYDLANEMMAKVTDPLIYTKLVDGRGHVLSQIIMELQQECHRRYANLELRTPGWKWEAHVVQKQDRYGVAHPSGELLVRPIEIDGEQICWPDSAPFIRPWPWPYPIIERVG